MKKFAILALAIVSMLGCSKSPTEPSTAERWEVALRVTDCETDLAFDDCVVIFESSTGLRSEEVRPSNGLTAPVTILQPEKPTNVYTLVTVTRAVGTSYKNFRGTVAYTEMFHPIADRKVWIGKVCLQKVSQ